jgi:tetratricopeptide (TPR) repeat protein
MRYIPDLIPKDKRVLPEYFKGHRHSKSSDGTLLTFISYSSGILASLLAIGSISHPVFSLIFLLVAMVFFPPTRSWLEESLVVKLTMPVRLIFSTLMITMVLSMQPHYDEVDRREAAIEKARQEKEAVQRAILIQKGQSRKDTLTLLLTQSKTYLNESKYKLASEALDQASHYTNELDLSTIAQLRYDLSLKRALANIHTGRYRAALPFLNELITGGVGDGDALYYRGLCYSKLGKIQEAVTDLRAAMEQGHKRAYSLHEQINPIRRRIVAYITRCCDGSSSNATGRGACSHHHGVCDWNDPVYQEYRKY